MSQPSGTTSWCTILLYPCSQISQMRHLLIHASWCWTISSFSFSGIWAVAYPQNLFISFFETPPISYISCKVCGLGFGCIFVVVIKLLVCFIVVIKPHWLVVCQQFSIWCWLSFQGNSDICKLALADKNPEIFFQWTVKICNIQMLYCHDVRLLLCYASPW